MRGTFVLLISVLDFSAFAQGTAFTYQGRLNSSGEAASGQYDLSFTLFNTNSNGTAIAGPVTNSAVVVSNELFTTTVDFGAGVFAGSSNWLELAVSTNGANTFTTLAPRQAVTPVPYAMFAEAAKSVAATNLNGSISLGQLPAVVITNNQSGVSLSGGFSGTFAGNGSGLTNVTHSAYIQVLLSSTQTVAPNNPVAFNTLDFFSGWTYNFTTHTLIAPNTPGVYLVRFEGQTSSANFTIGAKLNGSTTFTTEWNVTGTTAGPFSHSFLVSLLGGDSLQFINMGPGNLTLSGGVPLFLVSIFQVN